MAKTRFGLFLGTYVHEVTAGGRVALPSRFRAELSENQIVLVKSRKGCLMGFDLKDFTKTSQKVLEASVFEESGSNLREIFYDASPIELDRLGRFVLPEGLKRWSEIGEKVVLAGIGDAFEIWGVEKFPNKSALNLGQQ